jgi:hypothetical protein
LSLYAFAIGTALVVLLAAVAAWAALPKGGFMRRNRSDAWRHLPTELQTILDEFANSMETSQAEIQKAAKTSEAFMAAVKPIELVLRDFKKRITEFEKYGDESRKQAAELKSSLTKCQTSLEGNARAVERIDARLDEFNRRLAALTDGLSGLKQMSESSDALLTPPARSSGMPPIDDVLLLIVLTTSKQGAQPPHILPDQSYPARATFIWKWLPSY